jgi:heme/copper-type cytochrome/quinol oxidase subunit 2
MMSFFAVSALPYTFAQSPEVSAEWALFNQILLIGIAVGLVVFGIMFYAIIRYREKPSQSGG